MENPRHLPLKLRLLALLGAGLVVGSVLALLVLAGGSASGRGVYRTPTARVARGQALTDFTLPTLSGAPVTLSKLRGTPVLINFWGSWCPPCVQEMPLLVKVYTERRGSLAVLAVNEADTRPAVEKFVNDNRLPFPVLLDNQEELASRFGIYGYPTTLFVDAQGVLRDIHIGPLTEKLLSGYLANLNLP